MIKKICVICDNEFETKDTSRGRKKQTCSVRCARLLGSKNSIVDKECITCGKIIRTTKSNQLPRCDECFSSKRKYTYSCEICGDIFHTNKHRTRFCSRECVNKNNNRNQLNLTCYYCGSEFQRPSFTVVDEDRVFCSKRCNNNQYSLDNPSRYGGTWNRRRKEILTRDGNKCLLCNSYNELEVHHFPKLKEFDNPNDAHSDDNTGTFCSSCHRIVEEKYESLSHFLKDIV